MKSISGKDSSVSGASRGIAIFGAALFAMFCGVTCTAVAGDLLRGGFTYSQGGGSVPGSFTPPSVVRARQNAQDLLARTTQTIRAMSAMQSAARKLAQSGPNNLGMNPNNRTVPLPNVQDGLNSGGLVPDSGLLTGGNGANPVTTWTGATTPAQSKTPQGATVVTVNQSLPDAVLNWTSFNIGKKTTLEINQSLGGANESKWIAFNIIEDPSANPAQILGSIRAGGQVYVIDQNGIIFGGSSQINVHTLVASSLPINNFLITNGLLDNPDNQFLFSSIAQPQGKNGSPAFTPPASYLPGNVDGDVTVQAGAQIISPSNADHVGGRVALVGPNVTNNGSISTPDGQTILAAGLQVAFAAHPGSDPSLRGLDVYVGAVVDPDSTAAPYAGTATNNGSILASEGDVLMTGKQVNQLGSIQSSTSVTLNGRIDLLANYDDVTAGTLTGGTPFLQQETGNVIFGADSVSQILPELSNAATVVGTQLALSSQVNVQGLAIDMQNGAVIDAPGATGNSGAAGVNMKAGIWEFRYNGKVPQTTFVYNTGQISIGSGAIINVAGSQDVPASVSENILTVQLRGAELANSPLERTSVLEGQNLVIDTSQTGVYDGQAWIGTPLGNAFGYLGLIQRTAGEFTVNGGTVNLDAGGSVVTQPGSSINVSDGWIDYQGATVQTTRLLSDGFIYDIAGATPNRFYSGIFTGDYTVNYPKYGLSYTYVSPLAPTGAHYDPGYIEGGNGGSVDITAPSMALGGNLLGLTVAGSRQLSVQPVPGALSLSFQNQSVENASGYVFPTVDPNPPEVIIGGGIPLPANQPEVVLSPALINSDGFSILNIADVDGTVVIPAGVSINAPPNASSSITVAAANLSIGGTITAPGGTLDFTVYDFSPLPLQPPSDTPAADPARGNFTLGSSAFLSTAGLIVDNRNGIPAAFTTPEVIGGGTISIQSYSASLAPGSVLDVSGGVELASNGKPTYGNAGSILIIAGQDPDINKLPPSLNSAVTPLPGIPSLIGGKLALGATLLGYSGAEGGSLTIGAPLVQVGGEAAHPDDLLLSPDFFSKGGFGSFTIEGLGEPLASGQFLPGVVIAPDTVIQPMAQSLVVKAGLSGGVTLTPYLEPEGVRSPVSLTFSAPGIQDTLNPLLPVVVIGNLVFGSGAVIQTDASASVTFTGQTVAIEGSVYAPGGSISISGASSFPSNGTLSVALPTVDIGPRSVLSVAGDTVLTANARGYRTGSVLPGGTITVKGNIVGEAGSVLNVSGASDVLDLAPSYSDLSAAAGIETISAISLNTDALNSLLGSVLVPTRVDTSAGSIVLTGGQELYVDSTLLGSAGGPSAYGGNLSVSSGRTVTGADAPLETTLTVTQSGHAIKNPHFYPAGGTAIGYAVDSTAAAGGGYFAVSSFLDGGFDSLALDAGSAVGAVVFSGPVSITAGRSLDVAGGGVLTANSSVDLTAPYVALGIPFGVPLAQGQSQGPIFNLPSPYFFMPTGGNGSLTVTASLIDIGTLSLQNIGNVRLSAPNGDIRGDGTLDVAGKLTMLAGQIYTPTDLTFTIADYNQGTVTFVADGTRQIPLSAGGEINVYASVINQGGVLRAPLGTINLGWDGSGTSPADPLTGAGFSTGAGGAVIPTAATINLEAGSVTSVSQIDPATGQPVVIPYGLNVNSSQWLDPSSSDITSLGPPSKAINVSAQTVHDRRGASIDVRGGGDLLAYEFVPGNGGEIDVLGSPALGWSKAQQYNAGDLVSYNGATYSALVSTLDVRPSVSAFWAMVPQEYAILPGYQAAYAPYAPLSNITTTDAGYVSSSLAGRPLSVGDQLYLGAANDLPAGDYTLLPARYALLPGALLVTPEKGAPVGTELLPDGSSLVTGYRFDGLDAPAAQPQLSVFDVAPHKVIASLAQYDLLFANRFFAKGGAAGITSAPRLPKDGGHLVFLATESMSIQGAVESAAAPGGLGALVDIASPINIVIAGNGVTGQPGDLVLNSSELSAIGAGSLLIGGVRDLTSGGQSVSVATDEITVDNSGDPLSGSDIILAANQTVIVDPGSDIQSSGASSRAQDITVAGNGALLRVSSDPSVTVTRTGVTSGNTAELEIGYNPAPGASTSAVKITGASVTLDSSGGTYLNPGAIVRGNSVAINSGGITIEPSANSGGPAETLASGLVLSGNALNNLFGSAQSISLLSYNDINIYGTGNLGSTDSKGEATLQDLTLSAGAINGFNSIGGNVTFAARNIRIENSADAPGGAGSASAEGGTLTLSGNTISLGTYGLAVNQFTAVNLIASNDVLAAAQAVPPPGAATGSTPIPPGFTSQGNLTITTPLITGAASAVETISATAYSGAAAGASGNLSIVASKAASTAPGAGGLGASLTFIGAGSLTDNSAITARSGSVTLEAAAGNLIIGNLAGASVDVTGEGKTFFDVTRYTNAGHVDLIAENGDVDLAAGSSVSVAAQPGGGNAGSLSIVAPNGQFNLAGTLSGQGGAGGAGGTFSLDAGSLPVNSKGMQGLAGLGSVLNAASFSQSVSVRVRTGDVLLDGLFTTNSFNLSADAGAIDVTGEINASGNTGGAIALSAAGSVTLSPGALLTVAAQNFNDAQKGGSVSLEAGSDINGIASSSAYVDIQAGSKIDLSVANADPVTGDLAGTLLLRAPQTAGNTDLQIKAINGKITGASSITVEGYQIYNTALDTGNPGSIDDQEANVLANGQTFAGNTAAIASRLLKNNAGLASMLRIESGAEIINPTGDLTLASTWDLATARFGPDSLPGMLTLRAAGNLVIDFGASLTDGFGPGGQSPSAPLLPAGVHSWSYDLVAGADFSAADSLRVLSNVPSGGGSVLIGQGGYALPQNQAADQIIPIFFQTIRTGDGGIRISAGQDVQLLNDLATIYTAGTQAPALANFDVPAPLSVTAQYTMNGGDVLIQAGHDIVRYAYDSTGQLVPDSSRELPNNWMERQGWVDPSTQQFGAATAGGGVESTSWWIDFSNFFEGVGALGGGNVSLIAGNNVTNVDAAIPTNARMPKGVPDAANLLELGGGDLVVQAGNNISGGVYYVERGHGTITAGGQIETDFTRAAVNEAAYNSALQNNTVPDPSTWLPTTLFAGDATFDLTANGSILLGPVANVFLMPQEADNNYLDKTYFSTYAATDAVDVSSLSGSVTVRDDPQGTGGSLGTWLKDVQLASGGGATFAATTETWLASLETNVSPFAPLVSIMPPSLAVSAFSGDINLDGFITLSPATRGNVELFAAGSINGVQPDSFDQRSNLAIWISSEINLSDANPAFIPSPVNPLSFSASADNTDWQDTDSALFTSLDARFAESGSVSGNHGAIQAREALHAPGLLHAADPNPVELYALGGSISGLTLFSGKETRAIAGQDVTDVGFYVQNDSPDSVSVVAAGGHITLFDSASPLRQLAVSPGNELSRYSLGNFVPVTSSPTAGDIQINGPGTLEVLAGGNLETGLGANNSDGTGVGITSIGNARDPYLPFGGASIVAAAGVQALGGLPASSFDFNAFISKFVDSSLGARYFSDLAASDPGSGVLNAEGFKKLSREQQDLVALDLFFLVLRDAGRDHNLPSSVDYGSYNEGFAAVNALFGAGASSGAGDIDLTSREVKTVSGGDISLLAPSGTITVGITVAGTQPVDQGVLTQDGGNINMYTQGNVNVGTSRIFTLRGGNESIWSSNGSIDAGASSKTVKSAPPTRVILDPQSGDVSTDLAGLATGGGIGVLAAVAGVPPGSVDLIAPRGTINAGDAGIRATGNLNLAAVQILNASNIQAGGASTGVPTVTVAAPNLGAISAASNTVGAVDAAATQQAKNDQSQSDDSGQASIIDVEVVGYGGGDDTGI